MDGSIASSASLRMREQLRGAFHTPTGGAGAGLFEELLRMPMQSTRPEPTDKSPADDDAALALAAAEKGSPKPTDQPRAEEDDETDEEGAEDAHLADADASLLIQAAAPQPVPAERPRSGDEKATIQTQEVKDATRAKKPKEVGNREPSSNATHTQTPAAKSQPTAQATTPVPIAQANEPVAEVDEPLTAQDALPVEATPSPNDGQIAPVPDSLGDQAGHFDEAPHRSPTAKASEKTQTVTASVSPAEPQQQPHSQVKAEAKKQTQTQDEAATQTQVQANPPQREEPTDDQARGTDARERRDKWYVKEDSGARTENTEATERNAREDRSTDDLSPTAGADSANAALSSASPSATSDTPPVETAQLTSPPPAAAIDASAIASTLAQQSTTSNAGPTHNESRSVSAGIGQATGPRSAATSTTHAAGAAERDKEGVAGLSQQERVRLVQRVARSFSRLGPDGGQVTLKLHPPQLGVLNMSVRIEGQTMTARLHTETTGARDAILENLPILRERLAEQGIEVESFQVEVASERNVAADGQSQSQTQSGNPFSGDSSGDSRSGPRSVDYRRLSRNGGELTRAPGGSLRTPENGRWSVHSPLERSLDVRA